MEEVCKIVCIVISNSQLSSTQTVTFPSSSLTFKEDSDKLMKNSATVESQKLQFQNMTLATPTITVEPTIVMIFGGQNFWP